MCVAAYGNCAHMLRLKTWGITLHAIQELVALVQIADHLCSNWTYSIVRVCVNYGNHLKLASGCVNKKHIFVAKKSQMPILLYFVQTNEEQGEKYVHDCCQLSRCGFFVVYLALSAWPVNLR